ncbi:MAG TPA: exopolysaccharide transport family protein [Acidobacteriaceae bacterium]|nr:exopolysaccharide transport family protein [Acidobacteriaceae bacterium]
MTSRAIASPESGPSAEWTLADLFAVLARRRIWIVASLSVCCALALFYGLCATPRYRATAMIEVQKQSHGAFGLDNTTVDAQTTALSDSFDDNLTLQTEIGILQSDALTLDVIQRAGLESTTDYFAPRASHFAWTSTPARRLFFWRKPLEPLSVPLTDAPNRRYAALKIFAKRSKIVPTAGTRLISISYSDPDPARAAAVVNALVQSLADYSFRSHSSAASQSAAWLQAQLAELKQQTDALDARAAALDRQAGAFGDSDAHNVVLDRLDELNAALSTAQSNRIVREAIWRAVQSGDAEIISGLGGNPAAGASTQNSFALLQSLRAQEAVAKSQIAESADRYGENWPALAEQRAGLATVEKSIQDEVRRLGDRARSDYEVSVQAENSARDAFDQQKALAAGLTGNALTLRLARQEADASRTLYTTLENRLQQTGVLEGLHSTNFTVVASALVPPPNHPSSPSVPLLAALALGGGIAIGCTGAIARELSDDAIHTSADLEALIDAPVFATMPVTQPARSWYRRFLPAARPSALALEAAAGSDFALPAPQSSYAEALHRLRVSLLLSHSDRAPQVIAILPTAPETWKISSRASELHDACLENESPSLALGLAAVLAQHGASVLCVDANLRAAPPAGAYPVAPGLSDLLAGEESLDYDHPASAPPLLSVVHAGPRPPCPSELIASARMASILAQWRQEFNYIVVDSPAAACADALVLAQQADAVLLSARVGATRRSDLLPAFHAISRQVRDHAVLGLVLEDAPLGGIRALA